MQNAWNVLFVKDEKQLIRVFEGDSPKASGAVDFAREQRKHGITAEIISRRRAYAPPLKQQEPPQLGMMWCPYCIKWRDFVETSIVHADYETPVLLRCPICTISVKDYWIRKYNPLLTEMYEIKREIMKSRVPEKPVLRRRRR